MPPGNSSSAAPPAAARRLDRSVARALRTRCGVRPGDGVLIAVSGGADSVALLRSLQRVAGAARWRLRLGVAHLQHHWHQADESHARFVQALAQALGLPCLRVDLAAPPPGENLEAAGRTARYRALRELAQAEGFRVVATGHHGDDQLETLLMRLVRGSSVRGLGGMAWRRPLGAAAGAEVDGQRERAGAPELIRPMLGVTREQVRDYLRALNQTWVEDPLNQDVTRWRARLRRDVLPVLRELRPDAARKAQELAEHARELAAMLQSQSVSARRELFQAAGPGRVAQRAAVAALPPALRAEVVRGVLVELGAPRDALSRRALAPLLRGIADGRGGLRRFDLPGGVRATLDRARLVAAAPADREPAPPGAATAAT